MKPPACMLAFAIATSVLAAPLIAQKRQRQRALLTSPLRVVKVSPPAGKTRLVGQESSAQIASDDPPTPPNGRLVEPELATPRPNNGIAPHEVSPLPQAAVFPADHPLGTAPFVYEQPHAGHAAPWGGALAGARSRRGKPKRQTVDSDGRPRRWLFDHWGYCEHFEEPPLGVSFQAAATAQIQNGIRSQMVLYRYDFFDRGTSQEILLKPRGHDQLLKMARLLPHCAGPIRIERTGQAPGLDEARRRGVIELLQRYGAPIVDEQVIVSKVNPGLLGAEGLLIYQNLLQQTESGGSGVSTGTSGTSTSGSGVSTGAGAGR